MTPRFLRYSSAVPKKLMQYRAGSAPLYQPRLPGASSASNSTATRHDRLARNYLCFCLSRRGSCMVDLTSLSSSYTRIGASASVPSSPTSFSDTKAKTDPIAIDTTMLIRGFVTTLAEKISWPGLSSASAATDE